MKNLLLVYVILLGCFSANAQEFVKKFRIEGHIKGLETPAIVYLYRIRLVHTVCVYQSSQIHLAVRCFQPCRISELY